MSGCVDPKLQFRVLYRQFLFRIADLEVLSAHAVGDSTKLLGQFAALLILISVVMSFPAFGAGGPNMTESARLELTFAMQHFLIATTLLAVGIFAVLTWDSTFPDHRDVLVLAPLPVGTWTVFRAKVAATATALFLVVVAFHCATGLTWPFALAPIGAGLIGFLRSFGAYWFTMLAAGMFVYCTMLAVQGLTAQIFARRVFLRVSGLLQVAAFCLLVCVYFLEPAVDGPKMLSVPGNGGAFRVPSYWFLGLLNQLNGSMQPSLAPLARRAWIAIATSGAGAFTAYALSYARTMRQIVEEPDIVSGFQRAWLPRFGDGLRAAVAQFSARTLARSRQHRLILAFYLGLGLAFTVLVLQPLGAGSQTGTSPFNIWHEPNKPLLAASVMLMVLAVVGLRVAFAFPLEPRANWIFRAAGVRRGPEMVAATRRTVLFLSVAPVWFASAAACFWLWPWRKAAAHIAVLGSLGMIVVDLALWGFRKIPFTCSYLPGKSQVHMMFLAAVGLVWLVAEAVGVEQNAFQNPTGMAALVALLFVAAVALRVHLTRLAKSGEMDVQFEEEPRSALLELGLFRDGAVLGTGPRDPPTPL